MSTPSTPSGGPAAATGSATGGRELTEDRLSVSGSTQSDNRSLGQIVSDIADDLRTLVRQEVTLAKTEIKNEATKAGKGAGMLGGAGATGYLALLFGSLTVMFALGYLMDLVWAALIVTVIWGIVAAVLASSGRKELRRVDPKLETTTRTLKEDAQWAKHPTSSS